MHRLLKIGSRKTFRASQEKWLDEKAGVSRMENFDDWTRRNPAKSRSDYIEEWLGLCAETPLTLDVPPYTDMLKMVLDRLPGADQFGLSVNANRATIRLSRKRIDLLRISGNATLLLDECAIRELDINAAPHDVLLRNCRIGTLRLRENSLNTFELIGGGVRRIYAPTPGEKSPFTGSVEIRNVNLSSAFENAQPYRNLRHHLTGLHNYEAASVFHAAEMQAEVRRQSWVDRCISYIYRGISNYGASSARPLLLFAIFVSVNFVFLLCVDGVATTGEVSEAEGWRYYMYGLDKKAQLLRAGVFSLSQTFNPLGIFGTRLLLSAKTPLIALVSSLLGIGSALSLTLSIFAIRRRFRLDRNG